MSAANELVSVAMAYRVLVHDVAAQTGEMRDEHCRQIK